MKASKANSTALLHIATQSGDLELVRYLLKQGFNAWTPAKYALPALGSAEDEDIALLLLQAGTDMAKMNGSGRNSFHRFAEDNHWGRAHRVAQVAWAVETRKTKNRAAFMWESRCPR